MSLLFRYSAVQFHSAVIRHSSKLNKAIIGLGLACKWVSCSRAKMSAVQPPTILHRSTSNNFTMCREEKCAMATRLNARWQKKIQQMYIHDLLYNVYESIHYLSPLHLCITVLLHRVAGAGGWVGSWEAGANPSCDWMKGRKKTLDKLAAHRMAEIWGWRNRAATVKPTGNLKSPVHQARLLERGWAIQTGRENMQTPHKGSSPAVVWLVKQLKCRKFSSLSVHHRIRTLLTCSGKVREIWNLPVQSNHLWMFLSWS